MKLIFLLKTFIGLMLISSLAHSQSLPYNNLFGSRASYIFRAIPQIDQSMKTTNTIKKIKATSSYTYGVFSDSFLVTEPSVGGFSRLYYLDLYVNSLFLPAVQLDSQLNKYQVQHVDFKKAIYYAEDFLHKDSMERTMDNNGNILYSYIALFDRIENWYTTSVANYQYDNQNRITSLIETFDDSLNGTSNSEYSLFYAPAGDYILSFFEFTNNNINETYYDSVALMNGKAIYYYSINSFDSTPLTAQFHYDNNGEFIGMDGYYGTDLVNKVEIEPKAGNSNFPKSYKRFDYISGNVYALTLDYQFDASNNRLVGIDELQIANTDTTAFTADISTDADGDITKAIWVKTATGDTSWITNIYYEPPSSISKYGIYEANIHAYPVPSKGLVNLSSSDFFDTYILYDQIGRVVETKTFAKTKNIILDLDSYSKGIFYLRVVNGDEANTIRLEKY